jgi:hypothetical protein
MRTLLLCIAWIVIFMLFFFLLSSIGLLWGYSYKAIISDKAWFGTYTILIGWSIATLCTMEINEEYL